MSGDHLILVTANDESTDVAAAFGGGRFKSCVIDADNYQLLRQRYIELNPVRAGMVATPGAYSWSSYSADSFGKSVACSTPHPVYLALGKMPLDRAVVYRSLFRGQIDEEVLNDIRNSVNQGMPLGNERFKAEIEALSARPLIHLTRGQKPKVSTEYFLL